MVSSWFQVKRLSSIEMLGSLFFGCSFPISRIEVARSTVLRTIHCRTWIIGRSMGARSRKTCQSDGEPHPTRCLTVFDTEDDKGHHAIRVEWAAHKRNHRNLFLFIVLSPPPSSSLSTMESSSPFASSSSFSTSSRHTPQSNPATPPRPRPAPRSSSSAFQSSRSSGYAPASHHRRAASSSSLLHSMVSSSFSTEEGSPASAIRRRIPPSLPQEPESPRFSHLLTSVLGSPFLTTTDLPTNASSVEMDTLDPCLNRRAASPTPSVDFSIIDVDPDDPDALHFSTNASIPGGYPFRRSRHWAAHSRSFSTSVAGMKLSRSYAHDSSEYNHHSFASGLNESRPSTPPKQGTNLQGSLKSLLPRIWDVLSSPGRAVMNFSPTASVNSNSLSGSSSTSSSRANSPSPRRPLTPISQSWYHATAPEVAKPPWNVSRHKKSRSRTTGFFSRNGSRGDLSLNVNYSELDPLDGDEGELIDDEACFIDVRAVTGIGKLIYESISGHGLTKSIQMFWHCCPPS